LFDYEFQSLASSPLTTKLDELAIWEPQNPGMTYRSLPGATPGASQPIRLQQMRTLDREFSAELVPTNSPSKPLRLLPAPLYRYATPRGEHSADEVIDGTVFSFVQATDPEVLLVIEAIQAEGTTRWQYAVARMSMVPMKVSHQDSVVWETDWARSSTTGPYFVLEAGKLSR
jgi:hypothetical protein